MEVVTVDARMLDSLPEWSLSREPSLTIGEVTGDETRNRACRFHRCLQLCGAGRYSAETWPRSSWPTGKCAITAPSQSMT